MIIGERFFCILLFFSLWNHIHVWQWKEKMSIWFFLCVAVVSIVRQEHKEIWEEKCMRNSWSEEIVQMIHLFVYIKMKEVFEKIRLQDGREIKREKKNVWDSCRMYGCKGCWWLFCVTSFRCVCYLSSKE